MYVYIYACSQINSIWTPNRFTLDSNIGAWDPQAPSWVPEVPRNTQKRLLLQFSNNVGARFGIDLCPEESFIECFPHEQKAGTAMEELNSAKAPGSRTRLI